MGGGSRGGMGVGDRQRATPTLLTPASLATEDEAVYMIHKVEKYK